MGKRKLLTRICPYCKDDFHTHRLGKIYCCDSCRALACRRRNPKYKKKLARRV